MSRFQSEMTSWAPILAKMACLSSIREAEQSSTRMDFSWSVFLALLVGGGRLHFFQNKLWTGSLKSTPENLGYNHWLQVFCWHTIAPFPLLLCQESFPMPKASGSSYVVPNHWHPLAPIRPHTRHVKKSWSFDQWPRLAEIPHIFLPGRPSCRRICSSPWMQRHICRTETHNMINIRKSNRIHHWSQTGKTDPNSEKQNSSSDKLHCHKRIQVSHCTGWSFRYLGSPCFGCHMLAEAERHKQTKNALRGKQITI